MLSFYTTRKLLTYPFLKVRAVLSMTIPQSTTRMRGTKTPICSSLINLSGLAFPMLNMAKRWYALH